MNECWMNGPEHLLCATLCASALDIRVCALQYLCGGDEGVIWTPWKDLERTGGMIVKILFLLCICGRFGITPLVPASPLQMKLTSARTASTGAWIPRMRWTRWMKWAMWPMISCSALRPRAPPPASALQCGSPPWWGKSQFAGYKPVGLFWRTKDEWRWAGPSCPTFLFLLECV